MANFLPMPRFACIMNVNFVYILLRAREVGSPANSLAAGMDQTDQPFSPSTCIWIYYTGKLSPCLYGLQQRLGHHTSIVLGHGDQK